MPGWVKRNLQLLPGNMPHPEVAAMNFIPPGAAASNDAAERQWAEVFSNYSAFWDNRLNVSGLIRDTASIAGELCTL